MRSASFASSRLRGLVFTSREMLPAPFDAERHWRELHRLDREDAVKLVERVLNAAGGDAGASSDAAREEIEQLGEFGC